MGCSYSLPTSSENQTPVYRASAMNSLGKDIDGL